MNLPDDAFYFWAIKSFSVRMQAVCSQYKLWINLIFSPNKSIFPSTSNKSLSHALSNVFLHRYKSSVYCSLSVGVRGQAGCKGFPLGITWKEGEPKQGENSLIMYSLSLVDIFVYRDGGQIELGIRDLNSGYIFIMVLSLACYVWRRSWWGIYPSYRDHVNTYHLSHIISIVDVHCQVTLFYLTLTISIKDQTWLLDDTLGHRIGHGWEICTYRLVRALTIL